MAPGRARGFRGAGLVRLRSPYDRDILRLAVPALGALAAEPLYLLADTAMVGHLGTECMGRARRADSRAPSNLRLALLQHALGAGWRSPGPLIARAEHAHPGDPAVPLLEVGLLLEHEGAILVATANQVANPGALAADAAGLDRLDAL